MRYAKDLDEKLFNALYDKIAKRAEEYRDNYARKETARHGSDCWNNYSEIIHNPWSDLLTGFCHNEYDEEDIKYCLMLGYVPKSYFRDDPYKKGKMPKSQKKIKTTIWRQYDLEPIFI